MQKYFDIIVIGAGIAGCHVAGLLAEHGLRVMIIEKSRDIKKDSGIVSSRINHYINFPGDVVRSKITKMKFISPSSNSFSLSSEEPFAYVLNREKFGKYMRKVAVEKGATLVYGECSSIDMSKKFIEVKAGDTYYCKMILGCDGAMSMVRKAVGGKPPQFFHGVMANGSFLTEHDDIEIHMNKYCSPHFFGWVIPQSGEMGVICRKDPLEYMDYLKSRLRFTEHELCHSPIPIGPVKSYYDRCLLIGDSCGQVKPATGGGIMYSLICAEHASRIVWEAFEKRDFSEGFMKKYEQSWKRELGKEIWLQLLLRKLYRKMTNPEIEKFFNYFGKDFQTINSFDYDKLSTIIWKLPRLKLIFYAIAALPMLSEWYYE